MPKSPLAILLASALVTTPVLAQDLAPAAVEALTMALQDERHAEAFYASVLTRFDGAKPFANIIEAERRHQTMLIDLFTSHGVPVPENGFANGAETTPAAPDTLAEACQIGVAAETANRDLYDANLLPMVADYPDIIRVMQHLRDASDANHLPAFQRCVDRT